MKGDLKTKKGIDKITLLIYIVLVAFGWINIYAVNIDPEATKLFDTSQEYFKQLIWIGVAILTIGIIMLIDSKFFVEFSYILYGIGILLLISVIFFGVEINNTKSWFRLGSISFQPVEVAKVATSLTIAYFMSRFGFSFKKTMSVIKLGLIWFLPIIIIILQNDTGSALVFFSFFIVFFREGLSPYIIILGIIAIIIFVLTLLISNFTIILMLGITLFLALFIKGLKKDTFITMAIVTSVFGISFMIIYAIKGVSSLGSAFLIGLASGSIFLIYKSIVKRIKFIGAYLFIFWCSLLFTYSADFLTEDILNDYQRTRIMVMLGIEEDPLGAGYNVNQSKIAIGSGGLTGKGFLQGTQTKFNFVPEQSTDFIFCTVGEEWGFAGTAAVVVLFLVLLIRIVYLAEQQHSDFSRIFGYCVASIFFFHCVVNIGMTIGLAPVIGIPLPFFSYGGSSLWGFTILLFIFLKLDIYRDDLIR